MRHRALPLLVVLAGAALSGCLSPESLTTTSGPQEWRDEGPPQSPSPAPQPSLPLASLPGWDQEDHVGAFAALLEACSISRDPADVHVCERARSLQHPTEPAARQFLEANFHALPLAGAGLLTGYFSPLYPAAHVATEDFSAPVRAPPGSGDPNEPRGDRAAIEASRPFGVLAWMRPEDLFFLQIQGSGVLEFSDGERDRAVFAGSNGADFRGIAEPMRQQGLLADATSSAEAIHDWLAANRGPSAQAVMDLNPRYVFFRLEQGGAGGAKGSAGVPLVPGRSVAVDRQSHAMGELLWIDAGSPALTGAAASYRRLAAAADTGGAIKGPVRADLYLGEGDQAGIEAGRVRHALRLYRLTPNP